MPAWSDVSMTATPQRLLAIHRLAIHRLANWVGMALGHYDACWMWDNSPIGWPILHESRSRPRPSGTADQTGGDFSHRHNAAALILVTRFQHEPSTMSCHRCIPRLPALLAMKKRGLLRPVYFDYSPAGKGHARATSKSKAREGVQPLTSATK